MLKNRLAVSLHLACLFLACLFLGACGSDSAESSSAAQPDVSPETLPGETSDLQPAIEISRSQGELPFHIYVSASDTIMDGIEHPYDQVTYTWDFGDSNGEELFTQPVSQQIVNANTDQQGPEAAYVYHQADSYQITLTASFQRGDELLQESTTVTVEALAWSGETRYIDPELGSDENDGDSLQAPWQSWSALSDWLSASDHRRALIKRGSQLPVSENMNISTSQIRIGAYGEGDNPELLATEKLANFIRLYPEITLQDHVYSNLTLNGNNGNVGSLIYSSLYIENVAYELEHLSFINMNFINDDDHELNEDNSEIIKASNFISLSNQHVGRIEDVLVWNSNFQRNHSFKNGIYAEMKKYLAIVGSTFSGGDGNAVKDHPIYPAGVSHALYRWLDFQDTFSNNFSINSASKDNKILQYTLVEGCSITGGRNGLDFTKHNGDAVGWFSDLIIQNNAFFNLGQPSQGIAIFGGSLKRASIRDNVFFGNTQSDIFVTKDGEEEVDLIITGNKIWKGSEPSDTLAILDFKDVDTLTLTNNILVNEGVSGGSRLLMQLLIPQNKSWHVDNNQYWADGINTPFKVLANVEAESNAYYNFSQWQALGFDINSVHADPMFSNPAQGEF